MLVMASSFFSPHNPFQPHSFSSTSGAEALDSSAPESESSSSRRYLISTSDQFGSN